MPHNGSTGMDETGAGSIIPGAYERDTLTHSQPGAPSGPAYGSDDQPQGATTMDEVTIREHEKEGGGAPRRRRD
jgi:hypothetical protein